LQPTSRKLVGNLRDYHFGLTDLASGITIPDITAVIDTGKEKTMRSVFKSHERQCLASADNFQGSMRDDNFPGSWNRSFHAQTQSSVAEEPVESRMESAFIYSPSTGMTIWYVLSPTDRAALELMSRQLAEQQTPEMLRLSLQDLVLRVKICNLGDVEQTLLEALDPPSPKNIRRAIESLKEVKALTNTENLTPLGKQLAKLPLDVFLGKLIIYGAFFKCLDAAVSIAAIISSKSPFVTTIGSNTQSQHAKLSFKRGIYYPPVDTGPTDIMSR